MDLCDQSNLRSRIMEAPPLRVGQFRLLGRLPDRVPDRG